MFKSGDSVICINKTYMADLTINNTYIVDDNRNDFNRFLVEDNSLFADVGGKKGEDLEHPFFQAGGLGRPDDHIPPVFKVYFQ